MNIAFADLKDHEDSSVDFSISGFPGYDIDRSDRAGQVTINISGRDKDGALEYDTVVDLELPMARVFAAAILQLADWVEKQDRRNRKTK